MSWLTLLTSWYASLDIPLKNCSSPSHQCMEQITRNEADVWVMGLDKRAAQIRCMAPCGAGNPCKFNAPGQCHVCIFSKQFDPDHRLLAVPSLFFPISAPSFHLFSEIPFAFLMLTVRLFQCVNGQCVPQD